MSIRKVRRILMIAPQPFFSERGTPFSILHRTRVLGQMGYQIDLVTYHLGQDIEIPNTQILRIPKIFFIKEVKIGPSLTKLFLDLILFIKSFTLLAQNNYHCLHAHEEGVWLGVILKKIFRLPLVYDMHSSLPEQLINYHYTKSQLLIKIFQILEKWSVKNSDIAIAICPHLGEIIKQISPHCPYLVIENASLSTAVEQVSPSVIQDLKNKLSLRKEKIILYTGSIEAHQNIDLLIKSIPLVTQEFNQVKCLIVGGEPKQIKQAQQLAHSLDLNQEQIIFIQRRPEREMPVYLNLADVLVSPRVRGSNAPLKIYTYLKSGKPIVATNLLTHTQALNHQVAILTEPTPLAFAQGILKLLRDESLGQRLGQASQRLMESKYSYQEYMAKTKQVYQYLEK